jgi:hypothetical protein
MYYTAGNSQVNTPLKIFSMVYLIRWQASKSVTHYPFQENRNNEADSLGLIFFRNARIITPPGGAPPRSIIFLAKNVKAGGAETKKPPEFFGPPSI